MTAARTHRTPKKVRNNEKYQPAVVIQAIESGGGIVTHVARALGCKRGTVYEYARRYPEVQAALDDARETLIDEAESALLKAVKRGEGWAVCFALKCLGKARGYVERGELSVQVVDRRSVAFIPDQPSVEEWEHPSERPN